MLGGCNAKRTTLLARARSRPGCFGHRPRARGRTRRESDARRDRGPPRRDVAVAAADGDQPDAEWVHGASNPRCALPPLDAEGVARPRPTRAPARREAAAPARVAVHQAVREPPPSGLGDEDGQRLLRWASDGPRLPAPVRPVSPPPQGHRRPLERPRADVGRRAGVPRRSRLLPLAQLGVGLRPDVKAYALSFSRRSALTTLGSAFPCVSRITCP